MKNLCNFIYFSNLRYFLFFKKFFRFLLKRSPALCVMQQIMLNSLTMKMGLDDDIDQQQTYFNQNTSKKVGFNINCFVYHITFGAVGI